MYFIVRDINFLIEMITLSLVLLFLFFLFFFQKG